MTRSLFPLALAIVLVIAVGCSGGTTSPVTPTTDMPDQTNQPVLAESAQTTLPPQDTPPPVEEPSTGHSLLGYWDCVIDQETGSVEFVPLRTSQYHFNLVGVLEAGPMNISLLEPPVIADGILYANVALHHPFPSNLNLSGFDVKGILITHGSEIGFGDPEIRIAGPGETRLLNADGFTRWWNPAEFLNGGILGYNEGSLGQHLNPDNAAILNGYKLFADGFDTTENMGELDPATRAFFQAGNSNSRHYEISLASGLHFNYAVDCSWASADPNPPVNLPDDFPPEANQAEPWYIEVVEVTNTLWYEDGDYGGNVNYDVTVYDWQTSDDIGTLTFECPGVFTFTAPEPDSVSEFTADYHFDVTLPDLTSANPLDVLITVDVPGTYDPALTGVDKPLRGYHRHITVVGDVDPIFNVPPVAIMIATTPTEIWVGETISFDASDSYDEDGFIVQFIWDFNGDGVYFDSFDGDPETPTHTFNQNGIFDVRVKVRDNSSGSTVSDPVSVMVTLDVNDPPVAEAEATTATQILEDETVSFDGSMSYDLDGTVVDWQWDFDGDGDYSDTYDGDMQTPTATFPDPGTFYVDLKVIDDEGGEGVLAEKIEIDVEDIPNVLPTADAIATTVTEINCCDTVTFDASGSWDSDGTIEQYLWDFDGDGSFGDLYDSGTDINPTKEFSDEGVWNVQLKVIDDEGGEDTLDAPIPVTVTNIGPEAVAVATTATEIYAMESVTFDASGSTDPDCDDTLIFEWDFDGDGFYGDSYDSGTDDNPTKIYTDYGVFNVDLKVTDTQGASDTLDIPIAVTVTDHPPISCAEITNDWPFFYLTTLEFDGSCSVDPDGTVVGWEWDLGADGSYEETGETANYYFDTAGEYEMQLRTEDDTGNFGLLDEPLVFHIYDDTNHPPIISVVNHSRTTSQRSNADEAVDLGVVFTDTVPGGETHTYLWTSDYGSFDDPTSPTPSWTPPFDIVQCDITVRVTDEFGAWHEGSCQQWVTQWPVLANNPNAEDGCLIIPASLERVLVDEWIDPSSFKFPDVSPNGNVLYINYWGTWCYWCIVEMPTVDVIYNIYKDEDFILLYHDIDEPKSVALAWILDNPYEATYWTVDQNSAYWYATRPWNGGSNGVPQHLVFDRDGRCRGNRVGSIVNTGIEPIDKYLRELI